jgi:hypothetical protein
VGTEWYLGINLDAVEVVRGWIVLDLGRDLQSTRCALRHSSPLTDLLK